jgi:putative membrane protein
MRFLCLATVPAQLILPGVAWAQERTWDWHWEMHPMWGLVAALAAGWVLLILFGWALLHLAPLILGIIAGVLGIRWLIRNTSGPRSDTAVAILRERYARGDISKEEFDAKLRDLGGTR